MILLMTSPSLLYIIPLYEGLKEALQTHSNKAISWLETNSMIANPNKSKTVIYLMTFE